MAIPRLISEAKSQKSLKMVENDENRYLFFSSAYSEMCGSLFENEGFWARRGLEVGWGLAGCPSLLKMLEPKDPIRPRWGVKKRKRFWLPPKKDLLSVGWSFRRGSADFKNG